MDHARHLSSPSPTSSFLFQHSDRPFKSNLLDADEPDDMDGMHNMLSASSASSTTTMTLLNDHGHSHNPFARISLEEYSPLSLVDECDNPLSMSPNSLACGPNHPFKTSLSNLDVGVGDVSVHHVVGQEHEDDVVVGARSMSPTLLSATTNALHHHLWSNSSTAITQNPALLASSSASFLLSQHSFLQQLDPQSLDDSPPLLANSATSSLDFEHLNHHHHHHHHHSAANNLLSHRPSSEPPPPTGKVQQQQQQQQQQPSNSSSSSTTGGGGANSNSRRAADRRAPDNIQKQPTAETWPLGEPQHSSKVHLQLNHQQKLKELQQRLFGPSANTNAPTTTTTIATPNTTTTTTVSQESQTASDSQVGESKTSSDNGPYSSDPASTSICASNNTNKKTKKQKEADTSSAASATSSSKQTSSSSSAKSSNRVRVRITPRRRSRAAKNEAAGAGSSLETNNIPASSKAKANGKLVATETAEPDTTTKTSECIKLADLLASGGNLDAKNCTNVSMMLNNVLANADSAATNCDQNSNIADKRVQHIQFQVSPSLTVVSSGGLMQPISMQQQQQSQQQQQQQQLANNGTTTIVCSPGGLDNQVLCRPITVMTPMGANLNNGINGTQIKCNIVTGNELVRDNDTAMQLAAAAAANWSQNANHQLMTTNSSSNGKTANANGQPATPTTTGGAQGPTMSSHQIAIQVICQDGTSLVLPVSSAATLNGLSLAPQSHQQLQAILANGAAGISNQQQARNMLPLVSVANLVAQQQQQQHSTLTENNNNNSANSASQNGSGGGGGGGGANSGPTQTSGLAASSPTLAALLDAGSQRTNNNTNGTSDVNMSGAQRIVSTNLLRKLMATNQANMELKRGEISLQPGTQIGLTNNGSLVTVCTAAPNSASTNGSTTTTINSSNGKTGRDKRIKLENNAPSELSNGKSGTRCEGVQTTLTIIEPQGLVVANGNTDAKLSAETKAGLLGGQANGADANKSANNNNKGTSVKSSNSAPTSSDGQTSKQSKMTSSTGNRQVDPTQPFRCEHCNSTFTRLGNFTRHKKIHTVPIKDGQRFKCDVCSKSFLQRCDLARHLHIHRGTEPHRCNICGKGYIRHSDLVTHQRFHNKEKPFGCPHCSKGFCQRGDLNRHLRSIHLQMKPILCPCCNRKFAKQETLLRHLNSAHRGRTGGQQATISLVTTTPSTVFNTQETGVDNNSSAQLVEPSKTVASLEAIQATLCKVQQSAVQQTVDPSIAVKVELIPTDEVVS